MPARQPFTLLCQAAARGRYADRADLHVHTTASDGTYTPAQVVELARRAGLAAVAITDHDTIAGVAPAQAAARDHGLEVIPGVEITAEYAGRETHLLGYFVRLDDAPLLAALERLRRHRAERFSAMVDRLQACGVTLPPDEIAPFVGGATAGRRHLALLLVKHRCVGTVREAFTRYLGDVGRVTVPKLRLPVAEALALVHGAGGVASWAHPGYDGTRERLGALRALGLDAIEIEYPATRPSRARELRELAAELGLAVTGGSDCHGPGPPGRTVGGRSVTAPELAALRALAGR